MAKPKVAQAQGNPRNPLVDVPQVGLNNIIALCARKAARDPASLAEAHDHIYRLLTLETTDRQNAWYETREAARDQYGATRYSGRTGRDAFTADLDVGCSLAISLPEPIAPLFCYALIRASARGLAGRLSVPMLTAVVEQGVWPAEAGLAYLQRLPDEEQVPAAMALALWLPNETVRRIIDQHQPLSSSDRALYDGCLEHAPDLMGLVFQRMSRTNGRSSQLLLRSAMPPAVTALSPSLSPALLGQAARFLRHCGRAGSWDSARAAIAIQLSAAGSSHAALALADGIAGHWAWVDTMAEVLTRLGEEERTAAVAAGLTAAYKAVSDLLRVRDLSPLLPHMPDHERTIATDMALRTALALSADNQRADALIGLLPWLNGLPRDRAAAALAAAVCAPDGDRQSWSWPAIQALAPLLPIDQVREFLTQRAQALSFGPTPLPALLAALPDEVVRKLAGVPLAPSEIAAVLPSDVLADLVKDALKDAADGGAVLDTHRERDQAKFVADIAAKLPEPVVRLALSAAAPEEGLARTRTDLFAELLPQLARLGHVEEALSRIRERLHGREAARALTLVAPYLSEAQRDEAIDLVTHSIRDHEADHRAETITALAPYLNKRQLRRALSLSVALGDREEMTAALTVLAEDLAMLGITDGALAALAGIPDPFSRARAVACSAEVIDPPERPQLLAAGLAACSAISEGRDRARALATLVPLFGPEERAPAVSALKAALADTKDLHLRIRELLAAIDGLPETERSELLEHAVDEVLADPDAGALPPLSPAEARWLRRFSKRTASSRTGRLAAALLASWAIGDGRRGVESLAGYLARLPEEARWTVLEQALGLAYAVKDTSLRARTLVTMTPLYPATDRRIMTLAVLDEALRQRDQERISLLADLAARLPEEERSPVTARMVQAMAWRNDETPRPLRDGGSAWTSANLHSLLAPGNSRLNRLRGRMLLLPGRACPLRFPAFQRSAPPLDQGAATSIYVFMLPRYDRDAAERAHAAAEVARRLPEARREPVLARALAAAREARYPSQRSKALREVAELSPARDRAALATEALAAAREIEPESALPADVASRLAELVPLLDASQREAVTAEALDALLAEERDPGMPSALADQLTETLVRRRLSALSESGDETWRTASLLPRLAALGHPEEALARIAALPEADQRAYALAACTQYLDEPQTRRALLLAGHKQGTHDYGADRTTALLLIRLVDLGHADEAAVRVTAELPGSHWMPTVVMHLLKHLAEAERPELALAALTASRQLYSRSDDRAIARGLAAYAMDAPRSALIEYMRIALANLSLGTRSALLRDLADHGAVIVGIDGSNALDEIARTIVKVCRWWPAGQDGPQPISWRPAASR